MCSNAVDYLSSSPSLFNILKLLSLKDISNCKLVNKHLRQLIKWPIDSIHGVVRSGHLNLKTKLNEDGSQVDYVFVSVNGLSTGNSAKFILTSRRLRAIQIMEKNNQQRVRKKKKKETDSLTISGRLVDRCEGTTDIPDPKLLEQIEMIDDEYVSTMSMDRRRFHIVDFQIDNIQDTLAELFYLVARCLKIETISIDLRYVEDPVVYETPGDIIRKLGEVVAECVSNPSTDLFNAFRNFEGIGQFCNNIGCKWLRVIDFEGSIGQFLGNVTNWNMRIYLTVDYVPWLEDMIELMERWQKSSIHIRTLTVCTDNFREFSWSPHEMASLLFHRLLYTIAEQKSYRSINGDQHYVDVFVRRDSDDTVLLVHYSRRDLLIHDMTDQ